MSDLVEKLCRRCHVSKPLSLFAKDSKRKDGKQPYCKDCNKSYRATNSDRIHTYREENRSYYRKKNAEYRTKNPDAIRERNREYYWSMRDQNISRVRAWQVDNPEKHCEIQARRAAVKLYAQPPWADQKEISEIYRVASEMRAAGHDVQVDHVVPLRSKKVCGLHVAANLQIIPSQLNFTKGNRYWPDMP